ncbi:MAG: molybdopterin synthase sulfur carrier subunit [Flavobacteriaceae bacterium]|nr:molybdopterin synthase sulfur carrier subunit [Flavobacteriaceae bacterium]|tara:strand:- start:71715 stop:71957 length:243 start_codon:yes stop_codon:yes gene_type:complete
MKVQVLFFGVTTDLMKLSEMTLEVNVGLSINDFRKLLHEKYPQLENLSSYAIALNEEYTSGDESLSEGDVVAVIPPVSGG